MKKLVPRPKVIPPDVFEYADYVSADAIAMQALERGDATPEQQQRALCWIVQSAALTHSLHYRADPHDHAFASGRGFVGIQIIKMLKLDAATLRDKDHE